MFYLAKITGTPKLMQGNVIDRHNKEVIDCFRDTIVVAGQGNSPGKLVVFDKELRNWYLAEPNDGHSLNIAAIHANKGVLPNKFYDYANSLSRKMHLGPHDKFAHYESDKHWYKGDVFAFRDGIQPAVVCVPMNVLSLGRKNAITVHGIIVSIPDSGHFNVYIPALRQIHKLARSQVMLASAYAVTNFAANDKKPKAFCVMVRQQSTFWRYALAERRTNNYYNVTDLKDNGIIDLPKRCGECGCETGNWCSNWKYNCLWGHFDGHPNDQDMKFHDPLRPASIISNLFSYSRKDEDAWYQHGEACPVGGIEIPAGKLRAYPLVKAKYRNKWNDNGTIRHKDKWFYGILLGGGTNTVVGGTELVYHVWMPSFGRQVGLPVSHLEPATVRGFYEQSIAPAEAFTFNNEPEMPVKQEPQKQPELRHINLTVLDQPIQQVELEEETPEPKLDRLSTIAGWICATILLSVVAGSLLLLLSLKKPGEKHVTTPWVPRHESLPHPTVNIWYDSKEWKVIDVRNPLTQEEKVIAGTRKVATLRHNDETITLYIDKDW